MDVLDERPDLILNIRKPVGWTSYDVIRFVKHRCHGLKVGHAGTLDPFAEGVLLVCKMEDEQQLRQIVNDVKVNKGEKYV